MDPVFEEYVERYASPDDNYIFVTRGSNMLVGKIMEKSIIKDNYCDKFKLIDIIDKYNINTWPKEIVWDEKKYKKGDIIESKTPNISFSKDFIYEFYWCLDISYNDHNEKKVLIQFPEYPDHYFCKTKKMDMIPYGACSVDFYELKEKPYIPNTVTEIIFHDVVEIPINFLPNKLKHLTFKKSIKYNLGTLPSSLISLELYCPYNKPIDNLPINLSNLIIDNDNFNQPIDNLPPNLERLETGNYFDHPIDNLPPNLKELNTGDKFNHPIDNLPDSIDFLIIGDSFNHPINNLPSNLEDLTCGDSFDYPIDNLPPNLKDICLGNNFNQPIDCLPQGLTNITLGNKFNQSLNNIPDSVTKIDISEVNNFDKMINKLPKSLQELYLPEDMDIEEIDPNNLIKKLIN